MSTLLRDIERLLKREIPRIALPGYDPDPTIKAEPIINGRRGGRGNGGGQRSGNGGGQRSGNANGGQRENRGNGNGNARPQGDGQRRSGAPASRRPRNRKPAE